jgi:hypothetical protein
MTTLGSNKARTNSIAAITTSSSRKCSFAMSSRSAADLKAHMLPHARNAV